jgi:membrane associated rhomboid family serine protease
MNNFKFGPRLSPAIKILIIFNTAVFLFDLLLRGFLKSDFIIYYFALTPELIAQKFYIWQIFTYQFLHGGFFHILFNMAVLWMFGAELEYKWGSDRFLKFYLSTGAMTGLMIFIFNHLMGLTIPTIGASGVVYAVMMVYAIYWGNRLIYIWMIIPIKVKYFVMIMGGVSFISMITPGQSNISHIGHLGGLISGFIYFKLFIDTRNLSTVSSGSLFSGLKTWKKKKEWEKKDQERYDNMDVERQVDEILGKISRLGIKSLSETEKKILKKASENLNGDKRH